MMYIEESQVSTVIHDLLKIVAALKLLEADASSGTAISLHDIENRLVMLRQDILVSLKEKKEE